MANKSVAYMLVAVLIGVTLITAVPDQIARYANPSQMLSVESGEAQTVESGESVELYWDSTSDFDNESDVVTMTGKGFADSSVNSSEAIGEEIMDLSTELGELEGQLENVSGEFDDVESSIADVESVAADAVAAAEAASEAVSAVAATANTASEASAEAEEAANAAKSAQSTLNMFMWYAFDALIAVGVYFLAKNRFG
jgi:methyl-accepting chemotaxis protein